MSFKSNLSQILFFGLISFALSASTQRVHAQAATPPDQSASNTAALVAQADDPELKPPNPPTVICKDGALSIAASNSTLSAVLQAVRACTGTEMEIPDSAADERLFASLGPGPIKQILASLLGDTDFNYLIQISDSDPAKVKAVVLMARTGSGPANVGMTAAENGSPSRRAWQQARRNALQSTTGQVQDSDGTAIDSSPAQAAETAATVAAPVVTPGSTPDASSSDPPGTPGESAALKTGAAAASADNEAKAAPQNATQQLIQDMRRMFEERRQMQERPTQPQPK